MTYTEAQTEFSIRLYRWAKNALEKEMLEGFPRFQLNKDWSIIRRHFFETLDHHSKIVFGQGLLQLRHQNAVKLLREMISEEAEALIRREEAFRSENNAWARASGSEANLGNQTLATRRSLKKAISTHFRAAFGDECVPSDPIDGKIDVQFRMVCHGWIIKTEFEFGRWDPEITYAHDVWTGKLITKEEPRMLFANCLGFQLNYGNEIGMGSGWEGIQDNDVERICLTVVEHCRIMVDVLPNLLEGLDLELLTI